LLINKGINSKARDQLGHTPADVARTAGHSELAQVIDDQRRRLKFMAIFPGNGCALYKAYR